VLLLLLQRNTVNILRNCATAQITQLFIQLTTTAITNTILPLILIQQPISLHFGLHSRAIIGSSPTQALRLEPVELIGIINITIAVMIWVLLKRTLSHFQLIRCSRSSFSFYRKIPFRQARTARGITII